ncbi:MAG: hypothetical protein GY862_07145 [Gammaproteobacteria bacterium]|nr:hypothetical protein [Gammaproteobacteria bacterium]
MTKAPFIFVLTLKATRAEIDMVIGLLQSRGLVHRLKPVQGSALVLLKPELINQYASSVIQAARNDPLEIGTVSERDILVANLPLTGFERLEAGEEKCILESTGELLIKRDLCFREMGFLVFPSQINRTRPDFDEKYPPVEVTYRFSGGIETI